MHMEQSAADPSCPLHIGVAEVEITPPPGTHIGGDACRLRLSEEILDPLYGRVLIVKSADDAQQSLCLVTLDVCTCGNKTAYALRSAVAQNLGIGIEAVMLHLMQNHSGPSLGGHLFLTPESPRAYKECWWTYQGDPEYPAYLLPRLLDAVKKAQSNMRPVEMCINRQADERIAHNRRFVMRDGWVQTQASDLSQILHVEGPIDPEVGVAGFRDQETGAMLAVLLHHTAHPCSYFGTNKITASWPGAWANAFKRQYGNNCIPLVINGCCGNINTTSPLNHKGWTQTDEQLAGYLMESTTAALDQAIWHSASKAAAVSHIISLPFASLTDIVGRDSLEAAQQLIEREPAPRWVDETKSKVDIEWLFALYLTDMHERLQGHAYPYEVQVFRIGALALPGLIGEPFVEGQLKLKRKSPAAHTFVAHMCNGWAGYIPPRESHSRKHYLFRNLKGEPVRRGANFYSFPDYALDRIVDTSLNLLNTLFPYPVETC